MGEILCLGYVCYDICFQMDEFPTEDMKYMTDSFVESGGGPAANAAYLLSIWGAGCSFGGLIGDDNYGKLIISEFKKAGTNLNLLEKRQNHLTPLSCIIASSKTGSRTILNRRKSYEEMDSKKLNFTDESPKIILIDGHEYMASLSAMKKYKNAVSVLDAGSLRESTRALSSKVDYLLCSERFALEFAELENLLSRKNQIKCLDVLRDHNENTVVITMGDKGLIYNIKSKYYFLPAYSFKTVDSSAAGDYFHGTFVYCLLNDFTFEKALCFSSFAAGLSTEKQGTRSSLPDLAEVKKMYYDIVPELIN